MLRKASAVNGYATSASDGRLGTVSDFLFDDASWLVRWLVVDTGKWLSGRKVLLPPSVLGQIDSSGLEFAVSFVLIKSAEALEHMEKVDTLVVDKTGTLTEGKPKVTAIVPAAGLSESEILPLAASLERSIEHPLAAAIVTAARDRNASIQEPTDFASITGKGVTGKIGGRSVALGNAKLMADLGIKLGDLEQKVDELRGNGATALFLTVDGKPGGVIAIADLMKSTTLAALDSLRNYGIRIEMLTGDNKTTAEAVARKLVIKEVEVDILPQDKHRIVKKLTTEGRIVATAGDGVNDAPALAEAAVGIAMGTGTEVAIQSAGITLVKGGLAGIARAIVLSRAPMRNIRRNLVFAFAYNGIGIPIAAGVLYPALGLYSIQSLPCSRCRSAPYRSL
jgi:Cu+-exporting ATPase